MYLIATISYLHSHKNYTGTICTTHYVSAAYYVSYYWRVRHHSKYIERLNLVHRHSETGLVSFALGNTCYDHQHDPHPRRGEG